jgi:hypothetical protein
MSSFCFLSLIDRIKTCVKPQVQFFRPSLLTYTQPNYLTLRSVSSLNYNPQNSEMKFYEKNEVDMWKIIRIALCYTLNKFITQQNIEMEKYIILNFLKRMHFLKKKLFILSMWKLTLGDGTLPANLDSHHFLPECWFLSPLVLLFTCERRISTFPLSPNVQTHMYDPEVQAHWTKLPGIITNHVPYLFDR